MRDPQHRLMPQLMAPLLVLACLAIGVLGPQRAAHADAPTVSFDVVNGRIGLIHIRATGLPPDMPIELDLVTQTLADPTVLQYLQPTTSDGGTLDLDDNVGEFICGTRLQLIIKSIESVPFTFRNAPFLFQGGDILAMSPIILGQCPTTTPIIGITGVTNNVAQVNGQGFNIKETVGISITSMLTGFSTGVVTQTDLLGGFTAQVPLGAIRCGDTLTPHAAGLAGSLATGAPFAYVCSDPPEATPGTAPATTVGAGQAAAPPPASKNAHLVVSNSPPVVSYHQLETVRVDTGLPFAMLHASFAAPGLRLTAFAVRADNQGRARVTYMAQARPHVGQRLQALFTITYSAGGRTFHQTGVFTIAGS